MKLYSENKQYKLYNGNMLDMLEVIEKESVDSIVCDPPYELNFMNKGWDNSGIAFNKETWKQCYEVLKPGGYLLAFGGSRTYHRIACAIEDAGFEIRDTIMWLYGSGFPKSMNIGLAIDKKNGIESKIVGIKEHCKKDFKENNLYAQDNANKNNTKCFGYGTEIVKEAQNEWEGWGTALKPSFEPIIVARKPFKGSCVDNVIKYGVGGINIDECRVGTEGGTKKDTSTCNNNNLVYGNGLNGGKVEQINNGRFPANTILTYDETDFEEVCGGFPITSPTKKHSGDGKSLDTRNMGWGFKRMPCNIEDNGGSAARYFYCAKASKKDRDEGLEEFEDVKGGSYQFRQDGSLDGKIPIKKNTHPTVKPTDLMQYLIRLVTPNGGTVLDPFNGSGSTGKAVMYENKEKNKNYKYIGIELTEEYLPIAKARIEYVCDMTPEKLEDMQTTIFDFIGE